MLYFKDYMGAEKILLPILKDLISCLKNAINGLKVRECDEFFSLAVLVFFKLDRFQDLIDLIDSYT